MCVTQVFQLLHKHTPPEGNSPNQIISLEVEGRAQLPSKDSLLYNKGGSSRNKGESLSLYLERPKCFPNSSVTPSCHQSLLNPKFFCGRRINVRQLLRLNEWTHCVHVVSSAC